MNWNDELRSWGERIVNWLPNLLVAIIVLVIGWIVAAVLKSITTSIMKGIGLNRIIEKSGADDVVAKIAKNPSETVGGFVYWLVMIITFTIAIGALQIPVLTTLVNGIYGYIPNILAAILILALAIAFSSLSGTMTKRWLGDTLTGKLVSTIIPILILSISGFAILEQLRIAPAVVLSTYIALIGAISLGFALAFGLGGRDVAAKILDQTYEKSQRNTGQIRNDFSQARDRAEKDMREGGQRFKR